MALSLRVARAFDEDDGDFARLALAAGKYWVCKRGAPFAAEALECLGGNGYIETDNSPVAQFYRDIQIGTVWEGSGNVIALDVLRAIARTPESLDAVLAECELARGADSRLDAHLDALRAGLPATLGEDPQWSARGLVEDLALALQGSLLVRHAPPAVADAFCAGRLANGHRAFGTLPRGADASAILERAFAR
jgi:putative acyl-CoA dehydrogenase